MEESKTRYIKFYWQALPEFDLKHSEALLMFLVDALSKRTGLCYMSKANLARVLCTSETTVYSLIRRLREKGLILTPRHKKSNYGTFFIETTPVWDNFVCELKETIIDGLAEAYRSRGPN